MADEIDHTQERMDAYAPFMIANSRKPEGPKPNGSCHYCGDPLDDVGARFCNNECRDDYEVLWRAGKI